MKYIITEDQYEFITENNIERDVKYLNKVLNSRMFLDKYPCISMVSVEGNILYQYYVVRCRLKKILGVKR